MKESNKTYDNSALVNKTFVKKKKADKRVE